MGIFCYDSSGDETKMCREFLTFKALVLNRSYSKQMMIFEYNFRWFCWTHRLISRVITLWLDISTWNLRSRLATVCAIVHCCTSPRIPSALLPWSPYPLSPSPLLPSPSPLSPVSCLPAPVSRLPSLVSPLPSSFSPLHPYPLKSWNTSSGGGGGMALTIRMVGIGC